jgi:hypothetical protein
MGVLNLNTDFVFLGSNSGIAPSKIYAGSNLVWQRKYMRSAIESSDKGSTWTLRNTPYEPGVEIKFFGVCWAPSPRSLFVAVANDGPLSKQIMTSPDGITWTPRSVPQDTDLNSVAYSPTLDRFIAVGFTAGSVDGQRGFQSSDGITWTTITSVALAALAWRDITWSPEKASFCAVAQTNSTSAIAFSPDGLVWTRRASAGQGQWQCVQWCSGFNGGAGFWLIVGNGGVFRIATAVDQSSTGFTGRATAWDATLTPRGLGYSPVLNMAVLACNTGSVRVAKSTDGINWTDITADIPGGSTEAWAAVEWCGDRFILTSAGRTVQSLDGITWTGVPAYIWTWKSVAYSPELNRIVMVAQDDNQR